MNRSSAALKRNYNFCWKRAIKGVHCSRRWHKSAKSLLDYTVDCERGLKKQNVFKNIKRPHLGWHIRCTDASAKMKDLRIFPITQPKSLALYIIMQRSVRVEIEIQHVGLKNFSNICNIPFQMKINVNLYLMLKSVKGSYIHLLINCIVRLIIYRWVKHGRSFLIIQRELKNVIEDLKRSCLRLDTLDALKRVLITRF